ncbi:MAG TPA: hypothetical protein VLZ74_15725 [Methylocella sp.]|nr:hypothetical protein [Methylocella sp.]
MKVEDVYVQNCRLWVRLDEKPQIGEYEKEGKKRVSPGATADHVLGLCQQKRSAKAWFHSMHI